MLERTGRLSLPYMAAAQAQKHVIHNAAIRQLDALAQLALQSRSALNPPGAPSDGQCWFVPAGASGLWAGKGGMIAAYEAGAWDFFPLPPGSCAYVIDEGRLRVFDGAGFVAPLAASPHQAGVDALVLEEDVSLAGAMCDTQILIRDRAIVLGVSCRTLATVRGAKSYDCGVASERSKFGGSLGVAEGSVNVGVIGPTAFYAPTPIRLSANGGAFAGGRVRIAIHMLLCVPPIV